MSSGIRRLFRVAFALSVVTALVLTLRPVADPQPPPFPYFDKVAHAGMWAVMSLLGVASVSTRRRLLWIVGFLCVLGLATESIQTLVPGRSFEWLDLAADCAGALLIAAVAWRGYRVQSNAGSNGMPVV